MIGSAYVSEGPGPVETYATCSGHLEDGTPVSFEVRSTAIVDFVDGVLVRQDNQNLIDQLSCQPGEDLVPGVPSAGQVDWICTEYKNSPRMGYSIVITSGGVLGNISTGLIQLDQIYPLPPKAIGRLVCR